MTFDQSIRIVYAAGPGDVAGTYRSWATGKHDRTEFAKTYSGDFFTFCEETSARAWVHSTNDQRDRVKDQNVCIIQKPVPWEKRGGWRFHASQLFLAWRIMFCAVMVRADLLVVGAMIHWWLLAPLKLFGVKVIPTLHCAFWPTGCRSMKWDVRLRDRLNGWFWSHIADATIAVSPECERQVYQISTSPRGRVFQSRAQYEIASSSMIAPADFSQTPKRVLYAGRIESNKGVFDLVDVAWELEQRRPGQLHWTFCGHGSEFDGLQKYIQKQHLTAAVQLAGRQDQSGMRTAYQECHFVVVPTTREFAEGLNKVAVEAALARRPVVTSRYSNALDVLQDAAIAVPPDNPQAYVDAIQYLIDNPQFYYRAVESSDQVRGQFQDPSRGWKAALHTAVVAAGIAISPPPELSVGRSNTAVL